MANANSTLDALQPSSAIFRFKVPNISELGDVYSDELLVQGVPWIISIHKTNGLQPKLDVQIRCSKVKSENQPNWSHPAWATIELFSFNEDDAVIERNVRPHIFDNLNTWIRRTIIDWRDLFDESKRYVKDNAIDVNVEIIAENPDQRNKSVADFQNIEEIFPGCGIATFRVTIKNIGNLMVVRASTIKLRGIKFLFTIFRCQWNYLGFRLYTEKTYDKFESEMTVHVKLISSKLGEKCFENTYNGWNTETQQLVESLISWNELNNPENGYIENDSVTLEVKIKFEVQENNATGASEAKRNKLECDVCQQSFANQPFSHLFGYTICRHLLCSKCIEDSLQAKKCGFCHGEINRDLQRFVPIKCEYEEETTQSTP